MRNLKENDYRTFEQLCGLTQKGIKKTMSNYLKPKYKNFIETEDYICAEGDIPIALVAHMDTVFAQPAQEVYYDRKKNVIWSPDGLGADDRAGIFAIIQIVRAGLRPHIILTTDEERGAIGAAKVAQIKPFADLRYIIQLDRRGANDCVFYDCDSPTFIEYIESFGFVEAIGSFSDISVICPAWGVAGVNLSIGYRDEHSLTEILHVGHMQNTVEKVMKMLQATDIPKFEYIKSQFSSRWFNWVNPANPDDTHCCKCKKEFRTDELIPVKTLAGTTEYFCIECINGKVDWCKVCGEAYETSKDNETGLCEDCWYDFYYNR